LQAGGSEGSVWWREITNIRDGVRSVVSTWYHDNLCLKVGNGSSTLFWFNRWLGEVPFQVRFRRVFDLAENKLMTVAQMYDLGWDIRGGAWRWRRRLQAWEEELLEECKLLLLTVVLQVNDDDVWS